MNIRKKIAEGRPITTAQKGFTVVAGIAAAGAAGWVASLVFGRKRAPSDPHMGIGTVASMATRWSYFQSSADGPVTIATNIPESKLAEQDATARAAADAAKASAWRKRGDGTVVQLVSDPPSAGSRDLALARELTIAPAWVLGGLDR